MKALNKVTALQLIRNMKQVEYRNGLTTLEQLNDSENNLSKQLNK